MAGRRYQFSDVQQGLGGNATAEQTYAAQLSAFINQSNIQPEVRSTKGCCISARTPAHNRYIGLS